MYGCNCEKEEKRLNNYSKWKYSIYTLIILIVIINPYFYKITNILLGNIIGKTEENGCPTLKGIVLHLIIFTIVIRYVMELPI